MFYCHAHSWSHYEKQCPICAPEWTTYSSGTTLGHPIPDKTASTEYISLFDAHQDLLAKHTKVLEMLRIAEEALERSKSLFAYCAGPTRDVKTGKLLDGARCCAEALGEIERLKK